MSGSPAIVLPFALASYLLGSVPTAYLVGRARGVDIRTIGSGNVGATNVFRSVSKTLGVLTFLADALKGFVPAMFFPLLARRCGAEAGIGFALAFAGLAVAGHNWPVFLRFKGGKGVATSAGALLGVAPAAAGVGFAGWLLAFLLARYVSVASMVAAVLVAVAGWLLYAGEGLLRPVTLTFLALLILLRHRSNIARLRQGTEHRFSFGRRNPRGPEGSP
jgi:acyl phosphate:glycerol-3-phosphate acyltransferase